MTLEILVCPCGEKTKEKTTISPFIHKRLGQMFSIMAWAVTSFVSTKLTRGIMNFHSLQYI